MKFYWIVSNIRKLKRKALWGIEYAVGRNTVLEAFDGFSRRERTYHTWPLFQVFLNQVVSGMSCSAAIAWGISQGLLHSATSLKTSAYCNAKGRLHERPVERLMKAAGIDVEWRAHKGRRVFGRDVKVVDGTTVQLPDTSRNQAAFPQPDGQKPGCGQPVMRVVVLTGLATGEIVNCALGAYRTHERELFREMWPSLKSGDILLGDRGFGSYAEVAVLMGEGIDFVFRQKDKCLKNKNARKVGKDEWVVEWKRPGTLGGWVDPSGLPEKITVRAIRFNTGVHGFRSKEIIIFTSLADRKKYPAKKLIELYYRRWELELRIRDVKTTMGMELLKSKTPSGCRKELWMGLLAYNLIRGIMLDASLRGRLPISRISFAATLHWLDAFAAGKLATADPLTVYTRFLDYLIDAHVPERPGRAEPRKRKRRPKNNYSLLTAPRNAARLEVSHA